MVRKNASLVSLKSNNPSRADTILEIVQTQEFSLGGVGIETITKNLSCLKKTGAKIYFVTSPSGEACRYNKEGNTYFVNNACDDLILARHLKDYFSKVENTDPIPRLGENDPKRMQQLINTLFHFKEVEKELLKCNQKNICFQFAQGKDIFPIGQSSYFDTKKATLFLNKEYSNDVLITDLKEILIYMGLPEMVTNPKKKESCRITGKFEYKPE